MVKLVDTPKLESMTPIAAQTLLLALAANKLKVTLKFDGGNYEVTLGQLEALGLVLDSTGVIKRKTDVDGLARVGGPAPELLLRETLTWTVAASKTTVGIEAKGFRMLVAEILQTWSTVPGTLTTQPNFSWDNSTWASDDNDNMLTTLVPGNLRLTTIPLFYSPDVVAGQSAYPIGDLSAYHRWQFTTTAATVGTMLVQIFGVR